MTSAFKQDKNLIWYLRNMSTQQLGSNIEGSGPSESTYRPSRWMQWEHKGPTSSPCLGLSLLATKQLFRLGAILIWRPHLKAFSQRFPWFLWLTVLIRCVLGTRGGVQNPKNFVDVIKAWPPNIMHHARGIHQDLSLPSASAVAENDRALRAL